MGDYMFREDYIKDSNIIDKSEEEHKQDLYIDLENSKIRLNNLHENLNYVSRRFNWLLYLSNKSRRGKISDFWLIE